MAPKMGQKVSDSKVRATAANVTTNHTEFRNPFINLKMKFKTGTAKTVLANYAAYLFLTSAIYDL